MECCLGFDIQSADKVLTENYVFLNLKVWEKL